jgi:sRNA-binding protein
MPQGKAATKRYWQNQRQGQWQRWKDMFAERPPQSAIEILQKRWPAAFPAQGHLVKPLVASCLGQIAEATGWSKEYVRGVLHIWKSRSAYCRAVIAAEFRYDLDGQQTSVAVGDQARAHARQRLAENEAARLRRQEKRAAEASAGNDVP